ncbi:hypothetical protein ACVISU_006430 [Bradyrhizobium sp. USDA 4452]
MYSSIHCGPDVGIIVVCKATGMAPPTEPPTLSLIESDEIADLSLIQIKSVRLPDGRAFKAKKTGLSPGLFAFDGCPAQGPGMTSGESHNTRLLSFTLSASRYRFSPISLNLALIVAMPSSMVPEIDAPTPVGSLSVAA